MTIQQELAKIDPDYEAKLRKLALDIVKNVEDAPNVLERFGITTDEYYELAETTPFKAMLQQAQTEWEGAHNTPARVKLKSAALIEQALPDMFRAMVNDKEPLAARTALFTAMGKMGELGHAPPITSQGNMGASFKLEISFGNQPAKSITLEQQALPMETMPPRREFGDEFTTEFDLSVNDELLT